MKETLTSWIGSKIRVTVKGLMTPTGPVALEGRVKDVSDNALLLHDPEGNDILIEFAMCMCYVKLSSIAIPNPLSKGFPN